MLSGILFFAAGVFLGNMATVVGIIAVIRLVDVVGRWWKRAAMRDD